MLNTGYVHVSCKQRGHSVIERHPCPRLGWLTSQVPSSRVLSRWMHSVVDWLDLATYEIGDHPNSIDTFTVPISQALKKVIHLHHLLGSRKRGPRLTNNG